jgi:murein DD-endopeptidase MepM/ murein hydrolase activator NlpD
MEKNVKSVVNTKQDSIIAKEGKTAFQKNIDEKNIDELINQIEKWEKASTDLINKVNLNAGFFTSVPIVSPIGGDCVISAKFGKIYEPFTGTIKMHNGIDISAPKGHKILAPADGVVEQVINSKIWGKKIIIRHKYGFKTVYAHLGETKTTRGRAVKKGDVIGLVGSTGFATGPHLHYELLKNGKYIDPETLFFPNNPDTPKSQNLVIGKIERK